MARQTFNDAIDAATSPGEVAVLELCREYFTNPTFRAALEQYLWECEVMA